MSLADRVFPALVIGYEVARQTTPRPARFPESERWARSLAALDDAFEVLPDCEKVEGPFLTGIEVQHVDIDETDQASAMASVCTAAAKVEKRFYRTVDGHPT